MVRKFKNNDKLSYLHPLWFKLSNSFPVLKLTSGTISQRKGWKCFSARAKRLLVKVHDSRDVRIGDCRKICLTFGESETCLERPFNDF